VAPAKAGPDFIDPAFHRAASGAACLNYDPWAMRADLIRANAGLQTGGHRLLLVEAMMGLFDGAANGQGSAADLAALLQLPVVLVIDCRRMSHSVAALARGFVDFDRRLLVGGVILNRVASARHQAMLHEALARVSIPVVGALMHDPDLVLPERHLGLVQAAEHDALEAFIDSAADAIEEGCDLGAILAMSRRLGPIAGDANIARLPPLGQRIAIARDRAFAFCYEHMLLGWQRRGASLTFFSPLNDEGPGPDCDAVYLPGGYPELHAGALAGADNFRHAMQTAAERGARIYGECGGYMALGDGLVDAQGHRHAMLGLLPVETSFATPMRHLGYRQLTPHEDFVWPMRLRGHEFHYASVVREGDGDRLFRVTDALGVDQGPAGLKRGNVAGSFMHVVDQAATT
jgi:cobyrinic acid a,c-diamide synthase